MNIIQFLRIVWARRTMIAAATIACIIGAALVVLILPPRWQAHSRVMLNTLKPDPVTGEVLGSAAKAYATTQTELIQDYTVAGQVPEQLGWLSDPTLIAEYSRRPKRDTRDFRRWLAQLVIDRTEVKLLEGSNIIEITYTATTPEDATLVANALRQAYINTTLTSRQEEATRNAAWFQAQADKARQALNDAMAAKGQFERANGIVMQDNKVDVDSARLAALSTAAPAANSASVITSLSSPAAIQLAQADAAIAEASRTLGPNHPQLQAMRANRASLAALVAKEKSASGGGGASLEGNVRALKERVMSQRGKLGELMQLQSDVDLKQAQYNKTAAKAAEFRQQASVLDTGLTPLGAAVTPKDPAFPNLLIIVPGSVALGLAVGVLTSLLAELFARRVRGVEDLKSAVTYPVLGYIPSPNKTRPRRGLQIPKLGPKARQRAGALV